MKKVYVNGQVLDPAAVAEQRIRFREGYQQQLAETLEPDQLEEQLDRDALDNVIDDMLLTQAADKANANISDRDVKQQFDEMKKDAGGAKAFYEQANLGHADDPMLRDRIRGHLRLQKYLERLGREVPRPSDEECHDLYEHNTEEFVIPEMVLASRIVQEANRRRSSPEVFADMLNIRQAILEGADFAEVAKMVSQDPDDDGNLGFFPRGTMEPALECVAFDLQEGEVSDVFQVGYRYFLVKVFARRPEEARDFATVCELIRDSLWETRKNERIGREADILRKAADIRVAEEPS